MCDRKIMNCSINACNCRSGGSHLSKAEMLEQLKQYKRHLESELRLVSDKLKTSTQEGGEKYGRRKEKDKEEQNSGQNHS